MARHTRLPPDIDRRLAALGDVLAASCPAIEFAYLFGSASTGRLTPSSDVDLAIHVDASADVHFVRLEASRVASRHLGTDAVDVVLLNAAPIALAGRVLTSRRVLVDRQPFVRHRYESLTARMFHDFRIREHRLLSERYARVVDRDLVLRKIAELDEYLSQLADYREIDLETYRRDWKTQRIVERTLHLIVETCMDVADHIVADARLTVPDTAAAAFETLAEHGIFSAELGHALGRMVGFRNILVHEYARLDSALVLRVLRKDLADVQAFREAVLRYLNPS